MRKTKKQNRWLALALCLCLLASVFPLSGMTYAAEQGCNHVHDKDCGYMEAVEGAPCTFTHEHDDACGYAEAVDAAPCSVEAAHTVHDDTCDGDPDTGEGCTFAHVHDGACGYAEAKEASPCSVEAAHIHDENCGYTEAVEGQPCTHVHDENCGGLAQDSLGLSGLGDSGNSDIIASGNCGGNDNEDFMQWKLNKNGVLTISGYGTMGNYYYMEPNQPPWKDYRSQITSVVIENDVAQIGMYAFDSCTNIKSVTFPDSLRAISDHAFYGCTSLETVIFPNSLKNISDRAFSGCRNLNAVTFSGQTAPTIGANVFANVSATGTIYYYARSNSYTDTWKNDLGLSGWTLAAAPVIFYQPTDQKKIAGETAVFSVTATGDPAPSYQWQESTDSGANWTNITDGGIYSGAATAALTLTGVQTSHNGYQYRCVVGNSVKIVDSNAATLTVTDVQVVDVVINETNFPDGKFRAWICSTYGKNDGGTLTAAEIAGITSINVSSQGISDLTGIKHFTALETLSCASNSLTDLNVTGLTSLQDLACYDNPFQSLKLPGGEELTIAVSPANSGKVMFSHNNLLNDKTVTLTATAESGYTFNGWTGGAGGSNADNSFTLSGNMTVTATFTVDPTAEYDPVDVAVINGIIENNGLSWTKDDPGSWNTEKNDADGKVIPHISWDDNAPKRIKELFIHNSGLTGTLDVTGLTSLQYLSCYSNSLTDLNVTGLTSLQRLDCDGNRLTELKLTGLASLQRLDCDGNRLTELKLTGLTSLQRLYCSRNSLNGLDVTGLNSLEHLVCSSNSLNDLNVTGLTSLQNLFCNSNSLTDLDVSSLTSLQYLYCYDNPFQSLKLPGGEELTVNLSPANSGKVMFSHDQSQSLLSNKSVTLTATPGYGYTFNGWTGGAGGSNADNSFTLSGSMSVTANFTADPTAEYHPGDVAVINGIIERSNLGWTKNDPGSWPMTSGPNPYLTWDGSTPKRVRELRIFSSGLTGMLDVTGLTSLERLDCFDNELTELKLTGLTSLQSLSCNSNSLTDLNLTGLTSLQFLDCYNNSLTDLNLTGLTSLQTLNCSSSGLTGTLDVTGLTSLRELNCSRNSLNDLNVTGLTSLQSLDCYSSGLTGTLDVSSLSSLQSLDCYSNSLNDLNVTGLTGLQSLDCSENSLTDLDMTGLTSLRSLDCSENSLTDLDMTGLTSLRSLDCYANPLQSLKLPGGEELTVAVSPANSGKVMFSYDRYQDLLNDKTVTLTATAEPGYAFTGWTGGAGGSNADNSFTLSGSMSVTANFTRNSTPTPTYSLTVQAGTGGKITQGASGSYEEGASITLKAEADAGYAFDGWTASNGGSFADQNSAATTFTMPGNATIVTANFRSTGGGSDPDPGPSYTWRTLTDPSGVRVSGLFTSDAKLEVKEMLLHLQGDCDVCDNIRERQKNGELIVLFDIALKSGKYKGDLDVEIPVGGQYNGQTIVIIHCKDKVMDSRTVTVENGMAKGAFSSLSPYAAAKVPGNTVITGLPESYTLLVGQSVSWTPSPAGGAWSYDADLLEMTQSGDTYTFKALKEGKATATYTVDGVPHTVTIAVNSSTIPQTGDTTSTLPWALLATAALLGCAALVLGRKGGYKKRHG